MSEMADVSIPNASASGVAAIVPPDNRSAPRLHFIDGLRGLAMLMVLLYHCWLFGGQWSVGLVAGGHRLDFAPLLGFGHIGVNLFLVLSGFCLYWPFVKAGGRREPTLWEFAKKRCRRILPPYYAALLLSCGFLLLHDVVHHTTLDFHYLLNWLWIHALMLHNLSPNYALSVNGSLWSLALEFQLYILFPVLVEAYRRFNVRGVLWTILILCSAYRLFLVRGHFIINDAYGYVLAYSIFGRAFEFALGMFTALILARRQVERKWSLLPTDFMVLAIVVVAAVLDGRHGSYQTLTDAMYGLLFAVLILAGSRAGTFLNRALSSRVMVALGLFSYSVYLIHLPLVMALGAEAQRRHLSNVQIVAFQLLFVVPLMLGLGYLFHLLFEKPFLTAPRSPEVAPAYIPVQKTFAE